MGNQPFNVVVILFWLATMSWLLVAKVWPPLRVGEPPNYASILEESRDLPPVCWRVRMRDRTVGWAATKTVWREDGIIDMYSRVYLAELPIDDMVPGWLGTVLKPALVRVGRVDFDKQSQMVLDPLGQPVGFESKVRVGDYPEAITVRGQVEGSTLMLSAQSGELSYKLESYLPPDALMTDELWPQARMPGLRIGQSWTVPMYSPLRPPSDPMEILQATVEYEDRITWGKARVNSLVIVYRDDAGTSVAPSEPRGRIWVSPQGHVLRQEVQLWRSRLQMVRLPDEEAEELWATLPDDWMQEAPRRAARRWLMRLRGQEN